MKVSIVTPSYNQAQFLEETILSVLNQSYPEIEYVIIDGGSTDGSLDIIRRYGDRLAYWQSGPDNGQADAINKGMAHTTGDIVSYLNSDDALAPGAVERIVEGFKRNPEAGVVYGATEKINPTGDIVKPMFCTTYSKRIHKTLCLVPQPSSFYSRAAWETCGPFNVDLHFVLDWDFLLKVERHFSIVAIPDLISRFRVYETTKSSAGGWRRLAEIARVGRHYNGLLDYNNLVYHALRAAHVFEQTVGLKGRPARNLVTKLATTLRDSKEFMVHDNV